MITQLRRLKAPFYVQFELTERCNNKCYFCYNPLGQTNGSELGTDAVKKILRQLYDMGVFRINFNGGEPLMRHDFLELISFAHELGFELHMNTNSTLVTNELANQTAKLMKSVCTSILHSDEKIHDKMTGRTGAYKDALQGINLWRRNGVEVEVNVCTSTENYKDIYNIGKLIAYHDCYALCSTRYILNDKKNKSLLLNHKQTEELIDILLKVKEDFKSIRDVSLPGPVPYCEVDKSFYEKLRILNIPCQYGTGLARISPTGVVTPCTISNDAIGNLVEQTFSEIWGSSKWKKYESLCHIPVPCRKCEEINECRGGCVVYDESIAACGNSPATRKWGIFDE
jgi:radical SAM protein with 4Fe4S-binding SPASM domain